MSPEKLKASFAPTPPPLPDRPSRPAEAVPGFVLNGSGKRRPCQAWRNRSRLVREILRQTRWYKIPRDKLLRAVAQRGVPLDEAKKYLAGEVGGPDLDWVVGDQFLLAISDICWAVALEEAQLLAPPKNRWHIIPYHPGVLGREGRVFGASRERFLEACLLSQPRLARPALRALRAKKARDRDRYRRKVAVRLRSVAVRRSVQLRNAVYFAGR